MAYLGLQPNTPLLNTSTQTFSGNAVATQFTLARSVASASDLDVMIGSTMQRPFTDYVAGNISLQFISPPASGSNNITVTYRAGALNSLDLTVNTFNAGTVAAPGVVSLAANNTGIYWANASSMSVTVSGTNRATFAANATSISTDTGALQVNGGLGVGGNTNIGGRVVIGDSTESTSVSTGAFKVSGGAGIVGNLNIGGDITCVGDFTVNGTFTTTGTDSLSVTDPFIFLANANPGDTYDTGVVAQYYDGTNTRYTGYFRDITVNKYKLFGNLLTQPTTTVDTTDPSFQYQDLILANLSASGNVEGTYFIGNGAALTGISTSSSNIYNANTSVAIAAVNANVNMVVNGSQIANVWSGGISVVGAVAASTTLSATGNITGGNLVSTSAISAPGNITSAANISGGNVLVGGIISSVGNIIGGNINTNGLVSTGGNVQASNLKTTGIVSAVGDIYGNNFIAATNLDATGNITGGNITSGQDIFGSGVISTTGNITGSYILGNGSQLTGIDATSIQNGTSNAKVVSSGGNVTISVGGTANIAVFSTLGANVTGWIGATGNLGAAGNVAFTGTTQNINIGTSQTTGNVTVGGASQTGFIQIGQSTVSQTINIGNGATASGSTKTISIGVGGLAGSTSNINIGPVSATTAAATALFNTATVVAIANTGGSALSVAGNITGANINTSGSGGNITGANVISSTSFTATANVVGGNIITAGAFSAASVSASGTIIGTGNITGGNVLTGGLVSATGNITGGNVLSAGLASFTGNITSVGNISAGNVITSNTVSAGTLSGTTVSVSGNITGGNVLGGANVNATLFTGGTVSVTGNITGGNLIQGTTRVYKWTTSETAPSNPVPGDEWFIGSTGKLYQYWNDGTGNAWVDQSQSTSFDTLAVSGNATITGTLTVGSIPTLPVGNITNTNANGVGNIGNSISYFNTAFIKATSAQYADLAEIYRADDEYVYGTVVVFGGEAEITVSNVSHDTRVAGVISQNPAHLMNSGVDGLPVALTGRVPCQVQGPVKKGDILVNIASGVAGKLDPSLANWGCVLGKSLEDLPGNSIAEIEVVVGRF